MLKQISSNSGLISVPPDGLYDFDSIQFPLFDQSEASYEFPVSSKPAKIDIKKKKIAFIVVRYGLDVNGGAELHCRMLAERLVANYQVEVLTTCIHSYSNPTNDYPEGEETINGRTKYKVSPSVYLISC